MAQANSATDAEKAFIREHWGREKQSWIADQLGRSRNFVRKCAVDLGLQERVKETPPPPDTTEWTDERVGVLTAMWKNGHNAREIAEELGGVTRNAVIGKAHRLGLSERQHPVADRQIDGTRVRPSDVSSVSKTCQWPIGHPHKPNFRFCGEPVAQDKPGRPYCPTHCKAAYRTTPTKLERAADKFAAKLLKASA